MNQRDKLIQFVKAQHGAQLRKYTNEPYFNHLLAVAEMADNKCAFGFEIGLCHDILEDFEYTNCVSSQLLQALVDCGYGENTAAYIVLGVIELTDLYTSEAEPNMNRKARKHLESIRLHSISPDSQTVKYCDLINNTESIVKYDPGFAVKYLAEKREILAGMNQGDSELYKKCLEVLHQAEMELNITHSLI